MFKKKKKFGQVELNLLTKQKVFEPIVQTPKDVKLIGYK